MEVKTDTSDDKTDKSKLQKYEALSNENTDPFDLVVISDYKYP